MESFLYGKKIKAYLVKIRELNDGQFLLDLEGISDVKGRSFYTRAGKIWGVDFYAEKYPILTFMRKAGKLLEQDDFWRKSFSTAVTFTTEALEKTTYNMIVMIGLSTPNKILGNTLFWLDSNVSPYLFRPVGTTLGLLYIDSEFFDGKYVFNRVKEYVSIDTLPTRLKPAGMFLRDIFNIPAESEKNGISIPKTSTKEEKCFISFLNSVLKENNNSLPSTYDDTYANGEKLAELLACSGEIDAPKDLAHLHS